MAELNKQQLDDLACEVIETINNYNIDGSFLIVLPDKSYDKLNGWKRWKPNIYEYADSKEDILSDSFNMFIDGDIHTMFNSSSETITEWKGVEYADRIVKCREVLFDMFRNYGLEWKHFYHGYGLSFRELK